MSKNEDNKNQSEGLTCLRTAMIGTLKTLIQDALDHQDMHAAKKFQAILNKLEEEQK